MMLMTGSASSAYFRSHAASLEDKDVKRLLGRVHGLGVEALSRISKVDQKLDELAAKLERLQSAGVRSSTPTTAAWAPDPTDRWQQNLDSMTDCWLRSAAWDKIQTPGILKDPAVSDVCLPEFIDTQSVQAMRPSRGSSALLNLSDADELTIDQDLDGLRDVQHRAEPGATKFVLDSKCMESINTVLERKKPQIQHCHSVWTFFEDPESSWAATAYASIMPSLILFSVAWTLLQTVEPPFIPQVPAAVVETSIEVFFTLELLLRFGTCPHPRFFLSNVYNVIDSCAVLPLIVRAAIGFVIPGTEGEGFQAVTRNFLFCAVPVLRLLKTLQRFEHFRLLLSAFEISLEALPICLFPLFLLTLIFSSLIFVVEPRDNIASLPEAMWLTLVTMTTVGYGDVTPKSTGGSIVVAVLVIVSLLYAAMPIGIIGQAFISVFNDRDRVLLITRTKHRLRQWGYTADDIQLLFRRYDHDGNGELDLEEFKNMIADMGIGLKYHRIFQLFETIDTDRGGTIDAREFTRALFPSAYQRIYESKKPDMDWETVSMSRRASLKSHKSVFEHAESKSDRNAHLPPPPATKGSKTCWT